LIVPFTLSVVLDLVPFGVVVANEENAMVNPATVPEKINR
jgi:heme/copper-type cytochrome/quinol oxidase subunit 4